MKKEEHWVEPVNNAKELVEFATNNDKSDKYIEIYTSINDDEVGTIRTIFLDFDLSKESILTWELNNTLTDVDDAEINSAIEKYKKTRDIADLTNKERTRLIKYLNDNEEKKLSELSEEDTRIYFYEKN